VYFEEYGASFCILFKFNFLIKASKIAPLPAGTTLIVVLS